MSYCVNCGVELDGTLKECPLCNTPVINPREVTYDKNGKMVLTGVELPTPFPEKKGQVETVKRMDMAILVSVFVIATSVVCGLLNLWVYHTRPWSLAVIGGCVLLWVFFIPEIIYTKQPIYVSILLDGAASVGYLFMLSFLRDNREWFWGLGVPIVILLTLLIEAFTLCLRFLPKSYLWVTLYSFTGTAILCNGLECIIDRYLHGEIILGWSAIVTTICIILDATIITLLSRKRLRNAIRRRLHF